MSRLAALTVVLVLAGAASAYAYPGDNNGEGYRQHESDEGGRPGRAREGGPRPDFQRGEQHGMPARPAPSAAPPPAPSPPPPAPVAQNNGGNGSRTFGGQNSGGPNNGGDRGRDWSNRDAGARESGARDFGNRGDGRGRGDGAAQGVAPAQWGSRNGGAPNGGSPNGAGPGAGAPRPPGDGRGDYALRGGRGRDGGDNDRWRDANRPDRGDTRWTERGRDTGRYAANDHRDFDGRNHGRPGEGRDFRDRDRGRDWYSPRTYNQYYHAQYRYRIAPYRYPYGWFVRTWYYGEYLPNGWYTPTYYLDWRAYGLDYPPIGCEWVRVGNNALLVDIYTGEILSIYYDLFW